jgi:hypothetical protein
MLMFLVGIWTDVIVMLGDIWDAGMSLLDKLATAVSTNLFIQILFAVIVFSVASFVITRVVTIVKKIAGGK